MGEDFRRFLGSGKVVFAPIVGNYEEIGEVGEIKNIPDLESEATPSCPFVSMDTCNGSITYTLSEKTNALWQSILTGLPSFRILDLAMRAKKERTRKKNINRLVKYWKKVVDK